MWGKLAYFLGQQILIKVLEKVPEWWKKRKKKKKLASQIKEILDNPDLSPKEKEDKIKELLGVEDEKVIS